MFNSSVIGDSGKVSVRRSAFSQTCALLSRYVKEKKAFGDLSFDVASNIDGRDSNKAFRQTTMNLFPVNQMAEEIQTLEKDNSTPQKPISSEIKSAPMTIFYGGQVIVINDLPAHKAKEIMELVSLGIFQNPNTTTGAVALNDNDNGIINGKNSMSKSMLDLTSLIPPSLNVIPTMQEPAQKAIPTIISDLPQKRKASLHRFLGKRKERVAAKAPYTISKPENESSKPNEDNPWLELAAAGAELR